MKIHLRDHGLVTNRAEGEHGYLWGVLLNMKHNLLKQAATKQQDKKPSEQFEYDLTLSLNGVDITEAFEDSFNAWVAECFNRKLQAMFDEHKEYTDVAKSVNNIRWRIQQAAEKLVQDKLDKLEEMAEQLQNVIYDASSYFDINFEFME